jgi:hypothetical protein
MAFEKAPPTGIKAMKEKVGNRFVGMLENFEEVTVGAFKDPVTDEPKPDYFYTFNVLESNFNGMKVGQSYRFASPTRFHRAMCAWDDIAPGQKFQVVFAGEEKTKFGGKAANFDIQRDNGK